MNIKRILVPYDFSESSAAALHYAARFADPIARLYIVHVDELLDADISVFPLPDGPYIHDSSWGRRRRKVMRQLARVVQRDTATVYEHHCLAGFPADEILSFAARIHADLIVMGSHGRTGLSRLVTGSVAEQVMRAAKCPVLICKAQPKPIEHPAIASSESAALPVGKDFAV